MKAVHAVGITLHFLDGGGVVLEPRHFCAAGRGLAFDKAAAACALAEDEMAIAVAPVIIRSLTW